MAEPGGNLQLDGARLWDSLMEMAKIGPGIAGGNNRQTLTDDDAEGRRTLSALVRGRRPHGGRRSDGHHVHATRGHRPDAAAGRWSAATSTPSPPAASMTASSASWPGSRSSARSTISSIKTRHPIVIVNWTNEEGTRFAPPMLASGVFAGVHTQDWAYDRKDAKGLSLGDELKRIGWLGDEVVGARKMKAFFELHIEQGPILEAEGKDIGVVTHGQGLRLAAGDADRPRKPHRLDAHAHAPQCRARHGAHHRTGPRRSPWSHQPAAVGAIGHCEVYPNSPQHHPRQGGLHHRLPLARPDDARRHGRRARDRSARRSPRSWGSASRSR